MTNPVIKVESLSKYYRLGVIGGGTLREDLSRWWAQKRGKQDPYAKIGDDANPQPRGGQVWALKDINLEVNEGEILGIIGRNGAGKSTLLKILSRITAPTFGKAIIKGRVGSLLEVGTGFHPELTGRENIYLNGAILGMRRAEVARKLNEIVEFAEVAKFVDTPVKRYSSGMLVRLAFAVAAHLEPEVLIVDEVLAVGDAAFQKRCLTKMESVARSGITILFVSHNMSSIQNLTTRCACISAGQIADVGKPSDVIGGYLGAQQSLGSSRVLVEKNVRKSPELGQRIRLTELEALYSNDMGFEWGEPFKIQIGMMSHVEYELVRLGFTVLDMLGGAILSFSTEEVAVSGRGPKKFVVEGGDLRLVPGAYQIAVSVFKGSLFGGRSTLDLVHSNFSIAVVSMNSEKSAPENWSISGYGAILHGEARIIERQCA